MLVKVIDESRSRGHDQDIHGVVIATTMLLAIGAPKQLLDGILLADHDEIVAYHSKTARVHALGTIVAFLVLCVLWLGTTSLLLYLWAVLIRGHQGIVYDMLRAVIGLPVIGVFFWYWRVFRSYTARSYACSSLLIRLWRRSRALLR